MATVDELEQENQEYESRLQREQRLEVLGAALRIKAHEQVRDRRHIEDRWIEDTRQYFGRYDPKTEERIRKEEHRSRVFVNITRSNTNNAEARLADMLLPADDRNWCLKPSPSPELASAQVANDNQGAEQIRVTAGKKARAMQDEIDDQLKDSKHNAACRRIIHDACKLGTGVLKGPIVYGKVRKQWQRLDDESGASAHVLEIVTDPRPGVEVVDIWNFFPDMKASRVEDAEFIFERSFMTKRQLRKLLNRPGFMPDQIRQVLQDGPESHSIDTDHLHRLREVSSDVTVSMDNRYEVWRYYGDVEKDDLKACGCDVPEDELMGLDGEVWFVGSHVIKADIALMDTGEFPYSVMNWEEDPSSIFGYGIPYQLRHPQRVVNAAWRMSLENAALSTGPQVVYNQQYIEPADGDWTITPRKTWRIKERGINVSNAFGTFDINSHQAELMAIFDLAVKMAHEETGLPSVHAKDQQQNLQTTGAASIVWGSTNAILRRIVKQFDDNITIPTISRFYDWNMQFNPKEDLKGDYEVDARGSTSLIAKELQMQSLIQLMQYAGSPLFSGVVNANEVLRHIARLQNLPVDELVKTDEEISAAAERAAQNQPVDPQIVKAEMLAQTNREKMQAVYQMHVERMQDNERQRMFDVERNNQELQVQIVKLMQQKEISAEQIKADLAKFAMKVQDDQRQRYEEMELKDIFGPEGNFGIQ